MINLWNKLKGVRQYLLCKYDVFIPFITRRAFDKNKLDQATRWLFLEAAITMGLECSHKFGDFWTFGFVVTGNMPVDYLWIEHAFREPTRNELDEVAVSLSGYAFAQFGRQYKWDKGGFTPQDGHRYRLRAVLSTE
ncbi:MAG: hypothetical protein JW908_00490 [Anaerolineales bacterium]|nr:hypothetical protein [Anaerolineales bacterium]